MAYALTIISEIDVSRVTVLQMKARCADAVFYNGRIYTMDQGKRSARAIAVSDGEIVEVGGDDDVKRVAPRGCRKVDLGGKVVLPGFIDCHTHFIQMGVDAMNVDLAHTSTIDEALHLMREASKKIPEGEWVIGAGWKESGWKDGRFVTAKDLDAACPRHPAVAHRVCGHMSTVNSRAISILGIDRKTPEVDVDSSGRLTGILRESAVSIPHLATAPDRTTRSKALAIATRRAHSLGVTSIDDNGQPEDFETYRTAEGEGKLKVRVWYNTPSETLDSMLSMGLSTGVGSNMLKLGGLKVFCDGALGARTAAISEPYDDDPGNKGMFVHERVELDETVSKANEAGIQLAIHAIGDQGIEAAISSLSSALDRFQRKDHRHRIEHLELPSREHLKTMRRRRIIASMQPNFVGEWGGTEGMYVSRLGRKRASRNNPFKEVLSLGVRLVFGSDCMPLGPLYGIHSAVNAPFEVQRLSPLEAIAAYTRDAACASFEEDAKGTISVGKLADLVVLSGDPLTSPNKIASLRVVKTIISGEVVYGSAERRGE
jgi:predicted amidohydrolase YtcJ